MEYTACDCILSRGLGFVSLQYAALFSVDVSGLLAEATACNRVLSVGLEPVLVLTPLSTAYPTLYNYYHS